MGQRKQIGNIEHKWGFGLAPVKPGVQQRRVEAARTVIATLKKGRVSVLGQLEDLSTVKGLFSRTFKRDQWDWFTVWSQLGFPFHKDARQISAELLALRRAIHGADERGAQMAAESLAEQDLAAVLANFIDRKDTREPGHGFVYVLSTREMPTLLKIGFTDRDVPTRVREINSATGVIVPFGARGAWMVPSARDVEAEIHARLAQFRVRRDREFFNMDFAVAAKVINDYVDEVATCRTGDAGGQALGAGAG
ncbi:GIY-YIG nuclease family protein [Streptomyces sp. NPDC102264]|uniref:GIY-YIG nuclease family protein n=1 Tax=Streptomyces sp. NPDC102264 TaxID=3366149 RepID=UPI00382762B2